MLANPISRFRFLQKLLTGVRQNAAHPNESEKMVGETRLLFLDDSKQNKPSRAGLGKLTAIGGISVRASQAFEISQRLDQECFSRFGLPINEPFKWSPNDQHWYKRLSDDQRAELIRHVLTVAADYAPSTFVTILDNEYNPLEGAESHEMCALTLTLERFNKLINTGESGIVIVDRPGSDKGSAEQYLLDCAELVAGGSRYASFKFACPIVSMPFRLSRILQLADLVVSITTAYVAGSSQAAKFFPYLEPLIRTDRGRKGGVGVKIHPDSRYANLYHWLLKDDHFHRYNRPQPMPLPKYPYARGPDEV